jgi:hypothetical protein
MSSAGIGLSNNGHEGAAGRKKRKRGKGSQKEEDIWRELERKRGEGKLRLRDVAQAPPTLPKVSAKLTAPT